MLRLSKTFIMSRLNGAMLHNKRTFLMMAGLTGFALYDMREIEKKVWKDLNERETRLNQNLMEQEARHKEKLRVLDAMMTKELEKINSRLDKVEKTLSEMLLTFANHRH
jgi:nitrogen regulatory protein PII-like uncharacterized protein